MGNRAVIEIHPEHRKKHSLNLGIYLHWNGGRDSVEPFLLYCRLKGWASPENDSNSWARLWDVISKIAGSSVYLVDPSSSDRDNYDNGVYQIKDWEIIGREFKRYPEQNEYDLLEFLIAINNAMPETERLTYEIMQSAVNARKKDILEQEKFQALIKSLQ